MPQVNVSIPPSLKHWIDTRVAEGRYTSASDYLRDLVRRDQDAASEETSWLRGLITQGLASGSIETDAKDVLREIMAEHPAQRG